MAADPRQDRRSSAPGKDSSDDRPPARRDRDRIFYSGEFARLEGVTQVATTTSTSVHNRLTHSYRVEQVARSIAGHLNVGSNIVDEDVVMAAALSHDIGHPPFGHTGEVALNDKLLCDKHRAEMTDFAGRARRREHAQTPETFACSSCKLIDGFEGNAQTFRVLTRLGAKHTTSVEPCGLDLTRAALNAASKYPWARGANISKPHKWGAYDCDVEVLKWVRDPLPEADLGPSLEAQVMDKADDIAYAVHDLEDFFKSGAIPLGEVRLDTKAFAAILDYVRAELPSISNKSIQTLIEEYEQYQEDGGDWRDVIDEAKFPTLAYFQSSLDRFHLEPYVDDVESRSELADFRSTLISIFINDLEVSGSELVFKTPAVNIYIEFLKQVTWYYVIDNAQLAIVRLGQAGVIATCFDALFDMLSRLFVDENDHEQFKMPSPHETRPVPPRLLAFFFIGKKSAGRYFPREVVARAVVDYICSLTDRETYNLAAQLRGDALAATPPQLGIS